MRPFCLLLMSLAFLACSESARDSLDTGRAALAEARYADAIEAAEAGVAAGADERTAWGLELLKLEALARDGRGEDTFNQLDLLAQERPDQVTPSQYFTTADQLRAAEQGAAAMLVLDSGLQRFPEDETLNALLEDAKSAAPGSKEVEMLKKLGYL